MSQFSVLSECLPGSYWASGAGRYVRKTGWKLWEVVLKASTEIESSYQAGNSPFRNGLFRFCGPEGSMRSSLRENDTISRKGSGRSIHRSHSYLGYVNSLIMHRSNCKLQKYTPPKRAREQRWDGEGVIVGSDNGLSQLQLQYLSFANVSICIQCVVSLLGLRRGLYKGESLCRNWASFISR